MNKVVLCGRMTKEPELRVTDTQKSVCTFTVAVDNGYGENKTTSFLNVVAWGKTAEFVNKYFTKGSKILFSGRIQTRNYDGKDGKKVYVTEIVADEVEFADSKKADADSFIPLDVPDDLPF